VVGVRLKRKSQKRKWLEEPVGSEKRCGFETSLLQKGEAVVAEDGDAALMRSPLPIGLEEEW